MSARRDRVVGTGRTNGGSSARLESGRARSALAATRRVSPPSTALAGAGTETMPLLPSVDARATTGHSARLVGEVSGRMSSRSTPRKSRPQTALATGAGDVSGSPPQSIREARSSSSTPQPPPSRFGNLPSNFWDVETEKWVEQFRDDRIKGPKKFAAEAMKFTKPQFSKVLPLRSLLLDPEANTMPPCRTQSEFLRNVRERNFAHQSYDIDGDGVIDHDDMRQAKRFDVDGVGVLRPEEEAVGKRLLAESFFRKYKDQLHLFNEAFTKRSEKDNVRELVTSNAFTEIYNKVKLHDQCLRNRASKQMVSCMALPDQSVCGYNYYTDKADATAWCDWGGMPRKVMYPNYTDHSGSREKLMQCRRISMRDYCSHRLDQRKDPMAAFSTKRVDLITNFAKWS